MSRIGLVDLGSQCQHCGKSIPKSYIMNVMVHWKKQKQLQPWCVECIAKAKPGELVEKRVGS